MKEYGYLITIVIIAVGVYAFVNLYPVTGRSPIATTTTAITTGDSTITPADSGVRGTVSLGPTCPVERIPPDPACADKGYAGTIVVRRAGANTVFARTMSDATGAFKLTLPPGAYTLTAGEGKMLPRCTPTAITVAPHAFVTASISCDTGIR